MNSNVPPSCGATASCLHKRLLEGDPVAPAEVAATFLEPLSAWLQTVAPGKDAAAYAEAAEDAVLDFIKNPAAYRPERLEATAYLRMAARRDLQNALRRERRHQRHRRAWNLVEQSAAAGKYLGRDDDPSLPLQIAEVASRSLPAEVWEGLTEAECRCLELMQEGERRTTVFAGVLGITDLPIAQQRREVKRVKDRLDKRVQRAEERHE